MDIAQSTKQGEHNDTTTQLLCFATTHKRVLIFFRTFSFFFVFFSFPSSSLFSSFCIHSIRQHTHAMLRLIRTQGQQHLQHLRPFTRSTTTTTASFQRSLLNGQPHQQFRFPAASRNFASSTKTNQASSPPPPPPPPPTKSAKSRLYRAGRAIILAGVGIPVVGSLAWVTYDALFEPHGDILHQKRPRHVIGGPKNLVMTHGCQGSVLKAEEIHQNDPRQRLVILGSGWGVSLYLTGVFAFWIF